MTLNMTEYDPKYGPSIHYNTWYLASRAIYGLLASTYRAVRLGRTLDTSWCTSPGYTSPGYTPALTLPTVYQLYRTE